MSSGSGRLARLADLPGDLSVDVVVVGGGITGVSAAREAAANGLSVLLVERDDFGSGTSSATTKFIHGGIRYLEQLQVGVVRESLRERRILALAAPHLVQQQRFLMPAWEWSRPGVSTLGLGIGLYGSLAFDRNRDVPPSLRIPRSQWLRRDEVLAAVPWLDGDRLRGAWAYYDTLNLAPERLLLEFLLSAVELGTIAVNHARVDRLLVEAGVDGRAVVGVAAHDRGSGAIREVRARVVVNAAGPWVDEVLDGVTSDVRVQRSKGVHVLVSSIDGMRQRDAVFARAPSGGHVIVAPWRDRLLIGPTDTPMAESVDDARATRADVDEVLGTLNATLAPGVAAVGVDDVVDTTVGVRPLIATGRSTYQSSRRHEIHDHADDGCRGLYSILGGKWTTGRATAEDLLQAMHRDGILGRAPLVSTRRLPISTAWAWADDAEPYAAVEAVRWADLGLAADVVDAVLRLYGTRARDVLAIARADPAMGVRVSSRPGVLDIGAQVVWAVLAEGAVTLPDVIDRRLVIGTLGGITRGEVDRVARIAAPLWGQDPTELTAAEWGRRMALRALWSG